MTIRKLSYNLSLADQSIIQSDMNQATEFAISKEKKMEIPISFAPANIGMAI